MKNAGLPEFTPYPLIPVAQSYVDDFDAIAASKRNWLAFFGKSGSGKSTQAFMVAKTLMERKRPVRCRCYWYPDLLRELSALRYDQNEYEAEFERLLDADLVLIDDYLDVVPRPDSFEEQVAIAIVKWRYALRKPLVLTSETSSQILFRRMKNHAEALIGRIVEMCAGRINVAGNDAPNYRLLAMKRQ